MGCTEENLRLKKTNSLLLKTLQTLQDNEEKSVGQFYFNGEEYCERHDMIRNEERCRESSCCHWNDYEEGEASFNGQGRCWSDIRTDTCIDMHVVNGEEYCERHDMLRNEERCRASSCCQWNDWEEGDASFNGQGRCWSYIGTETCADMFSAHSSNRNSHGNRDFYGDRDFYGPRDRDFYRHGHFYGNKFYGNRDSYRNEMNAEEYCESDFMIRNEESCKASSCCHWNTWEEGEGSFNGQGRCWSDIGSEMCTDMSEDHWSNFYRDSFRNNSYHNSYDTSMNGEEYCESDFMLRNEESCKASSCCQWNTWEEGDASFNGQGRCWSDIGAKMCTDIFEGSRFGKTDSYHYGSFMSAMGRRHTIMDTEKTVGSSSNRCMDRCQRDKNDYMTCMNRCPRAEESVSDRDSSSDSSDSSDDDFRPFRHHHRRRNCRENQYWDGYRCVYFDEKSVGSSSSRYSCMDRCQRDGHDYMTCRMRCPSEESVSDRDSSSDSDSSDDFHPSQHHRHNRRHCREDQYWNGERCVQARKYRKEEEGTYNSHRDYHSFGQPM